MKTFVSVIILTILVTVAVPSPSSGFNINAFQNPVPYTIFSSKFAETNPFWIKIGHTKYYLIHNRNDGNYTYKDLVGCEKVKKQLFEPFFELDTDGNRSKLSGEELLKAGVRFVSVKTNGKLELNDTSKDFPIEKIAYIDMITLATYADDYARPFGTFTMFVNTERGNLSKYIGHVSYVHPRYLEKMF